MKPYRRIAILFFAVLLVLFIGVMVGCAVGRATDGSPVIGWNTGGPMPEGAAETAAAIGGMVFGPAGAGVAAGLAGILGLLFKRHGDAAKRQGDIEATEREWKAASDHYNPPPKPKEPNGA